jgi:Kef-type K+ transport system membrane component KefB
MGVLATIGLACAFAAVLYLVARPLLLRFFDRTNESTLRRMAPLALVGVLLCAMATEWIGVHAMFGAFMFGLVFPRRNVVEKWLHQNTGGITAALLLPLFFAYSGLRTDIGLIAGDASLWLWCAAILAIAVAGKLASAAVAARSVGESWCRALQIGTLMNCRGLTELVVLNIGLDLGVLSPTMFTMLVIMALVSTAMTAPIAVYLDKRAARREATVTPLPTGQELPEAA